MKTVKIAFNERTNGVAADVALEETSENPDTAALMKQAQELAEQAQAIAATMSSGKLMRSIR